MGIETRTTVRRTRPWAIVALSAVLWAAEEVSAAQVAPVTEDPRILEAASRVPAGATTSVHTVETVVGDDAMVSFGGLGGVSVSEDGVVFNTNFDRHVWRISADGEVEVLSDEFTSASGNFSLPGGDLLQSDWAENRIYRVRQDGSRSVFSEGGLDGPVGIARHPDGHFLVANWRARSVARVPAEGGPAETIFTDPRMTRPNGVAVDDDGTVYVADLATGAVFRWREDSGVSVLAELPGQGNAHNVLARGALYVSKIWDHVILRVDLATGGWAVVAGTGHAGFSDGPPGVAALEEPNGMAVSPAGDAIYFNTHRGRMFRSGGSIVLRRLVLPSGG